jgi:FKBP-type peptidyl-prolyl cis-trans isomerase 2
MQKILTLIVTAAIIYMIFQHNAQEFKLPGISPTSPEEKTQAPKGNLEKEPELSGSFLEKTVSKLLINVLKTEEGRLFFENILQPMNQPIAGSDHGFRVNNNNLIDSMFKIKTFGNGVLGPASCGHIVTVQYEVLTLGNVRLEEKTDTFALGSEKSAPGLDAVVVGMKTGQTRHAVIPGKYAGRNNNNYKDSFKVNVLLKEIMPQNFVDDSVKIFDDEIAYKMPLFCSNKVIYDAKITRLSDGVVLFDSVKNKQKINMTIGDLTYPVIFSHALHNKIPGGTRTVIAKGKLFQSYASSNSKIFPDTILPKEEYFMVDFYNFDTGEGQ